jgi:hypothetical protein
MADDAKLFQSEPEPQRTADPSSLFKPGEKPDASLNVSRGAIRALSPDPSLLSVDDTVRLGRSASHVPGYRHASRSPAPPRTLRGRLKQSWVRNKGLALVLIAQLFGTLMNVTTRMLEMEGNDGKQNAVIRCDMTYANNLFRQRLSPFPHPVRENEHNCRMLITVHVV